jgi:LysR family transcriptional regulator, low CO2-responsive transcriptional regulator
MRTVGPDAIHGFQRSLFEQRVTIQQLRTFKTVADSGSFSRAAEQLHLSQPAVSHQMKALSASIGSPLFEEIGRRIQPTETGRLLYHHTSLILSDFRAAGRAIEEHSGLRQGIIRLIGGTTVGIYVLPDVLTAFKQAYPAVTPHLDVGNREHVHEQLLNNEADFAVVGQSWVRREPPMIVRPFLVNELIAIATPTHPLVRARRISLARLAKEPMILREPGSGTRETVEQALDKTGHPVNVAMELASSGAIKRAVARGLGVSILSRYAVSVELRMGTVVELPVTGFPLRRQWHLVYPRDRRFGPVGEAFRAFVDAGTWRAMVNEQLTGG